MAMTSESRSRSNTLPPGLKTSTMSDAELLAGERAALDGAFDRVNGRRLAQLLWFLSATLAIYAVVMFTSGAATRGAVAALAALADLLLVRRRRSAAIAGHIRQTVAAVLIGHIVVLQLFHGAAAGGIGFWFAVFPMLAARYRLASGETMALFASLYSVVAVRLVGESLLLRQTTPFVSLALYAVLFIVCFGLSWLLSRREEQRFRELWRAESVRNRDRLRMKRELEYAREIQLSMLPRKAPQLDWLDVAALSLPATEVGGDYYDYFDFGADRIGMVVGDVTGHGVASGLVLSGVRSSLNLLRDEMQRPSAVLDRVNRMLKRTSAPRMHMTLAMVVIDRDDVAARVATAGHPPVLIRRTTGKVVEVGTGSFPLGAMARARYEEERVGLDPGDVMLLYSDGLVETIDPNGEQFGWDRLESLLSAAPDGAAASEIRDEVLRELWDFKGDAEQVDDVTMVVVRYLGNAV